MISAMTDRWGKAVRRWMTGKIVSATILLSMTACAGGGGWQGPFVPAGVTPVPLASFSALEPGAVVDLPAGDAIEGLVRLDPEGDVTGFDGFGDVSAELSLRLDEASEVEALRLVAAGRSLTFHLDDPAIATLVEPGSGVLALRRKRGAAVETVVLITQDALDAEHQIAGIWLGGVAGTGEVHLGSGVFGAPTAAADPPADGIHDYQGLVVGIVALDAKISDGVGGAVGLEVDFAGGRIELATTESVLEDGRNEALDMSGTLTIDGAQFVGPVTTKGGLSGEVSGRFYGPSASEAGGVFDLVDDGGQRFTGSFGAAR